MAKQNHQLGSGHFRRVRVVTIGVCQLRHICLCVYLFTCISAAPTKRIFVEFYCGLVKKKPGHELKIWLKLDKNIGLVA